MHAFTIFMLSFILCFPQEIKEMTMKIAWFQIILLSWLLFEANSVQSHTRKKKYCGALTGAIPPTLNFFKVYSIKIIF